MKKAYSAQAKLATVTFSLPAEAVGQANSVLLLGDFNDWDWRKGIMLTKQSDGSFSVDLELEAGRAYQFRYVLDQVSWVNDWEADGYVASPYPGVDNCLVDLTQQPASEAAAEAPAPAKPKPKATRARGTKKTTKGDKLAKIEGIGPKSEAILREAGIETFAVLAETSPERIKEILVAAGPRYKSFDPSTWPEQAKLAAEDRWDELKTLQDELLGGRR